MSLFQAAARQWEAEVNTEAGRLMDAGEASGPLDAQRRAQLNVRARRQQVEHDARALLAKVADAGGPLPGHGVEPGYSGLV